MTRQRNRWFSFRECRLRAFVGCGACVSLVLLAGLLPQSVFAQQKWPAAWRWRFFPMPVRAPAIPVPEDEKPDAAEDSPSVTLPDNGDLKRRLEQIRRQLEMPVYADAARNLGQLLQDPATQDFFVPRDEQRRDARGFKAEIRQMIRDLPPEGRAVYVAQFEPLARAKLLEAVSRGDEASLREIVQRFPETKSCAEALHRLGHLLWDHGRPRAAAMCLARLRSDADSAAPFEPGLSVLLAACWLRTGEPGLARAVLASAPAPKDPAAVSVAGVPRPGLGALDEQGLEVLAALVRGLPDDTASGADWSTYRGDPTRNRVVPADLPLLAPRWTVEVSSNATTQLALDRACESYRDDRGTWFPMLHPLVVGDVVLMRTARGVAACDLQTGQRLWQSPADDDADNAGVEQILWREPAGGAFAADSECFYVLGGFRAADEDASVTPAGTLSAHEHARGRQGNLRWQAGGTDGGAEPALAGASFLGPPVSWHGRLYVEVEQRGVISLVALDAASGRRAWSQELALSGGEESHDPFRLLVGASPSISSDEIAVCPTSGGTVVAVDLTTQMLLWACQYPRQTGRQIDPYRGTVPRLDQHERWLDSTATIGGDHVILAPPESQAVYCLDLHDGRLLWTQPRGDGLYVACLTADKAIVVGRHEIRAYALADGKPAWQAPLRLPEKALPSGRGVYTGSHYFLPLTSERVVRIALEAGTLDGESRSLRETVPGNLVWHRGVFVSQGPQFLEAFDERAAVEKEVHDHLDRDPRDAGALVRQGTLALEGGDVAAAITAFRQAHAAAPGPKTKSLLVSALLDGLRAGSLESDALAAELERLSGP